MIMLVSMAVLRCIKLALVHDMAECIVGDIAPSDNISKTEKHRREEVSDSDFIYTNLPDILKIQINVVMYFFFFL